jgi:two-component system, LytTR family, sensor kinase
VTRSRLAVVTVAAWTLIALYFATQAYFNPAFSMRPRWGEALAINFVYYYLWAASTPLVIHLARRWRFQPGAVTQSIAVHVAASVAVTAALIVVAEIILRTFTSAAYRQYPLADNLKLAFGINFHSSLPTYWLILAVWLAAMYYRNATKLEAQLSRAQLDALKMQLNPHFLFNTLNSISSLMYTDVEAADAMLARLSELLRISLDRPAEQEVPLSEEVDFLRRYLDIERIRFEERLGVEIDVEKGTETALVPSLALQPLVENAIHHGIANWRAGGTIRIKARRDGEWLAINVADNPSPRIGEERVAEGRVRGATGEHPHLGLANTRARLQQLYGSRHTLQYGPIAGGGFDVAIAIPFRT